mgnify:CR=1 FL=1|tara:strand:+ start:597 stop:1421 length:825 start_codon:yes stop_codon:yes gene_type:complete
MAAKIKTDLRELDEIIENFKQFKEKTIPVLVEQHARLLAVELANRTQPFSVAKGSGKVAHKLGKNAVENDLSKVFRTKLTLQAVIDKTQNEKLRDRLQKLLIKGNNKKLGETLKAVGMIKEYEILSQSQLAAKHKQQRSPRSGRTWSSRNSMNISTSGLKKYTNEIMSRVGLSKAAWADCARLIGGIASDPARAVPAFAKAKRHAKNGKIIHGIHKKNPYVTMTSEIPWASRILRMDEIRFAHHIVRDKMIKMANKMIRAAAKTNFNPTPIENE